MNGVLNYKKVNTHPPYHLAFITTNDKIEGTSEVVWSHRHQ